MRRRFRGPWHSNVLTALVFFLFSVPGGARALDPAQSLFLSKSNTLLFKKRVFIRFNHLAYNNKLFNLFFVVLMLIYPSICLRVTRFFKCDHIGHLYVLGSDLYTTCFDTEWNLMAVPAVVRV